MARTQRRGFTLVELLVVIGIIALLLSILIPVLNQAKERALRVKCAAHLHNVGESLFIYANDNKGKLPQHNGGANWLWDIPFPTRDALLKSGNQRNTLYCPASSMQPDDQNANALWNFSGGYCVSGYFWLMRRPTGNLPPLTAPKKYLQVLALKDGSTAPSSKRRARPWRSSPRIRLNWPPTSTFPSGCWAMQNTSPSVSPAALNISSKDPSALSRAR